VEELAREIAGPEPTRKSMNSHAAPLSPDRSASGS